MSAICGIFNKDSSQISLEAGKKMMEKLQVYHVSSSDTYSSNHIFLGCHLQIITPESKLEKLPFVDNTNKLLMTADAIIDNRSALFEVFSIPKCEWHKTTDSQLILLSYKKWGDKCPEYLIGDFAFAIYDESKQELFCARDHVGKRSLYFYTSENVFAFCTVMKPLQNISKSVKQLNDTWIADFLSYPGPMHEADCNHTVFKDIMQLLPAHTIKVNSHEVVIRQYWSPLNATELSFASDEEYEEALRKVFFEAVRCRLRTSGSVGILLSGGIDSGSVACVAGKELQEQQKILYAFSSIPFSGYKDFLNNSSLANESEYIETIKEHVLNIEHTYCQSEGKNSVTDLDFYINLMEHPYKVVENFFWLNEIASLASTKGCTILLNGQFGNWSISYGDIFIHLVTLFRKMRWITLVKEMKAYSKIVEMKSYHIAKEFAKIILPEKLLRLYYHLKHVKLNDSNVLTNVKLMKKLNTINRLKNLGIGPYQKKNCNLSEIRKIAMQPRDFCQSGAINTKMSLAYGVQDRDPTMDKRVIEFCFSVPGNQYVNQGQERSLIRRAMKGILPDKVRLNYKVRGLQSADWIQRLLPIWLDIKREIEEMLLNDKFKYYIDEHQLRRILDEIGYMPKNKSVPDFRMVIVCLIFGKFINRLESE